VSGRTAWVLYPKRLFHKEAESSQHGQKLLGIVHNVDGLSELRGHIACSKENAGRDDARGDGG
jgi:hypothetical protein